MRELEEGKGECMYVEGDESFKDEGTDCAIQE